MAFWRLPLLLLAAAAGASLAGCSGGDSPLAALGGGGAPNAADAAFVRSMTAHAKGTLGISRLAQHRALRRELRGIARTMTAEQDASLHELGSLAQGPAGRATRSPTGSRTPASALLDLTRVKDASSFDYEFMRTMIEQNQAAIAIAREEGRSGSDPKTKRLASTIEAARLKELERIRAWLHLWYGDVQPGGGGGQTPSPGPGSRPGPPL